MTDRSSDLPASSSFRTPAGAVQRRTLVQGAAWTIPVVAVASGAPFAAASGNPTLAFTQPSYSGAACGVISGVQVRRTSDGTAPEQGQQIDVTLTDGYTFVGGATSYSWPSGADGTITLPDIVVPAKGGNSVFTAMSGALTATAQVTAPTVAGTAYQFDGNDGSVDIQGVPSPKTAVGAGWFITSTGDLYGGTTLIAPNVSSAHMELNSDNRNYTNYVSNGTAYIYNPFTGASSVYAAPGQNATALGGNWFLSADGHLYNGGTTPLTFDDGSEMIVSSAAFLTLGGGTRNYMGLVSNGRGYQFNPFTGNIDDNGVSSAETAVGAGWFITTTGDLYAGGTVIASNVTAAHMELNSDDRHYANYVSNGTAYIYNPFTGASSAYAAPGQNATPLGGNWFLSADGHLYNGGNTPVTLDDGSELLIDSIAPLSLGGGTINYIGFVSRPVC